MSPDLLEPLGNLTILIVEDDEVALESLKVALERRCRKILAAKDGDEGLKFFKNNAVDIVITDINLGSKTDGLSMVKSIRRINPNVPVIFMTAYSDDEKISQMIALNAVSLIKKEVDLEELFVLLLSINKQLHKEHMVDLGRGVFYRKRDKVIVKGYAIFELTDRESQILELLIKADGYPITYEEFRRKIWKNNSMTMDSLRMHINNIRRKTYYEMIKNHSRLGYKIQKSS
ncbi:transcriptional regulator [Helicobacter pullorum]|uniref:response regulator transcription factor n=1 Tax=Helicobacter pullorum TaxID=35818 RepID=UPI000816861B|nr:response regulator transcription factor [Helicobacter pullorum]HIS08883.1 response regulator transcription factor [Candidatus Scatomorpha intestinipullorum]OCR05073.1 transcriptional regulator [Helicobacter pullorum]OCR06915.1 transcriptional regulator [Helicobacter pullorum]OCR11116.1 transcriptional regulator [Helicobacter pullorum]OCR12654.1 transcriptional regulator [Helicobacter pullorum]